MDDADFGLPLEPSLHGNAKSRTSSERSRRKGLLEKLAQEIQKELINRYKSRHTQKFRLSKKSEAILKMSNKADRAYFKDQFGED